MQISNKRTSIFNVYVVIIISILTLVWLNQNSINAYWEQTYQQSSPIKALSKYYWWESGGKIQDNINRYYDEIKQELVNNYDDKKKNLSLQQEDISVSNPTNSIILENFVENIKLLIEHNLSIIASRINQELNDVPPDEMKIQLNAHDKVFFIGDSLMQGIAPHIQQWLKTTYNIQSINLSKQGTGLSYPSFFNWNKIIESNLQKDNSIALLIVFLGPNDPWDFPNPRNLAGKYLKFQSPEWEDVYISRIKHILDVAEKHNVKVIWMGVPYMKKAKLNQQVDYLNQLYENTTKGRALFIHTKNVLSQEEGYSDSILYNRKQTRVRSKDGIHFTLRGQQILAEYIQNKLTQQ